MTARHPDWEKRLADALNAHRGQPSAWGKSDCWIVACDCFEAVTDEALLPALRGYRTEAGGYKKFHRAGFDSVDAALASALPPKPLLMAQRGDLASVERDGVIAAGVVTEAGIFVRSDTAMPFEVLPLMAAKAVYGVG